MSHQQCCVETRNMNIFKKIPFLALCLQHPVAFLLSAETDALSLRPTGLNTSRSKAAVEGGGANTRLWIRG